MYNFLSLNDLIQVDSGNGSKVLPSIYLVMEENLKNFLVVTGLLAVLALLVAAPRPGEEKIENNFSNMSANDTVKAIFSEDNRTLAVLMLEKADTPEERSKGLMYRKSLENGTGMLFVWEDEANRSFWMKNTYIPLDMIFVTAEKTVKNIREADPQPNVSDSMLKSYTSTGPAKYVIETRQNFSDTQGIENGTEVIFQE